MLDFLPSGERFLVVDPDETFVAFVRGEIGGRGHVVETAAEYGEAVRAVARLAPTIVLVAVDPSPGQRVVCDGLRLIEHLRANGSHGAGACTLIAVSWTVPWQLARDAVAYGAANCMPRRCEVRALADAIRDAREPVRSRGVLAERLPSLEEVQLDHVHAVLHRCGGNVSEAARVLGVSRSSVHRWMGRASAWWTRTPESSPGTARHADERRPGGRAAGRLSHSDTGLSQIASPASGGWCASLGSTGEREGTG